MEKINLVTVHKLGDQSLMKKIRPIRILSIFEKVLESKVYKSIFYH